MKNLKIFSSISEYENAKYRGVLNVPNISFINESGSIICLPKLDSHIEYEYVDLGLSVKWSTCNVGASSPEEYGLYFAWGETTGYTEDDVTSGVRSFTQDEYNAGPAASISANLTLEQDAAHVNMGGNWRMPTKDEYQELLDNCDVTFIDDYNETGITGKLFTSKINGKSIFFPNAGNCKEGNISPIGKIVNYWTSSYNSTTMAYFLFYSSMMDMVMISTTIIGMSVRGVCE